MMVVMVVLTWIKWPLVLPYLLGALVDDAAAAARALLGQQEQLRRAPDRLLLQAARVAYVSVAWAGLNRAVYGATWLEDWASALGHYGTHAVHMGPWGALVALQVVVAVVRWWRA